MSFDIGFFWGVSQSRFKYESSSDIYNSIDEFIDVAELIVPEIVDSLFS